MIIGSVLMGCRARSSGQVVNATVILTNRTLTTSSNATKNEPLVIVIQYLFIRMGIRVHRVGAQMHLLSARCIANAATIVSRNEFSQSVYNRFERFQSVACYESENIRIGIKMS